MLLTSLLIALPAAGLLSGSGLTEENLRILIRWTARIAASLFLIAFGVSSVEYFLKDRISARVLAYRPHIGLAFGTVHLWHLLFLIALQQTVHPVFALARTTSLIGGGIAYGLLIAMMVTTFPRVKERMKPVQWRMLHLVGGYWLFVLFLLAYAKRVFQSNEHYVIFSLLVAVLILRIARRISLYRSPTPSPPPPAQKDLRA